MKSKEDALSVLHGLARRERRCQQSNPSTRLPVRLLTAGRESNRRLTPLRETFQKWVKPNRSNVPGRVPPLGRPNCTSRVFSGWSCNPYRSNRLGRTSKTLRASLSNEKAIAKSSAKRMRNAAPRRRGLTTVSNHPRPVPHGGRCSPTAARSLLPAASRSRGR